VGDIGARGLTAGRKVLQWSSLGRSLPSSLPLLSLLPLLSSPFPRPTPEGYAASIVATPGSGDPAQQAPGAPLIPPWRILLLVLPLLLLVVGPLPPKPPPLPLPSKS